MPSLDITSWGHAGEFFTSQWNAADVRARAKADDDAALATNPLITRLEQSPAGRWEIDRVEGGTLTGSGPEVVAELRRWYALWEKRMNDEWTRLTGIWEARYQPYLPGPKTLYDKARVWERISTDLAELGDRMGDLQHGTGWAGRGASAYRAMVPRQEKATKENGVLIGTAGTVLFNASAGTQALYLSVAQCLQEIRARYDSAGAAPANALGFRMKTAHSLFKAYAEFLGGDLLRTWQSWHAAIDKSVEMLADHESLDPVFVGGRWPSATVKDQGEPGIRPDAGAREASSDRAATRSEPDPESRVRRSAEAPQPVSTAGVRVTPETTDARLRER